MGTFQLELGPSARLLTGGKEVALRRKALALLVFLALEGPTERERLATLLWRPRSGLQNLRVELGAIRRTLGLTSWAKHTERLALPPEIEATRREPLTLENLFFLAPEWDRWLEQRRAPTVRGKRPREGLLILEAFPGDDVAAYLDELKKTVPGPLTRIESATPPRRGQGLWVFVRSAFGEDPAALLGLRALHPPERTCYETIPPVPFPTLATRLGFTRAARRWLSSAGRGMHLAEAEKSGLDFPIKLRTLYALEARRLSQPGRRALEILALHPGPVPEIAIEDWLGEELEELLTRRWLRHTPRGWRFRDPVARRALEATCDDSLKHRRHQQLEEHLRNAQPLGAAFHALKSQRVPHWPTLELAPWAHLVLEELRGQATDRPPPTLEPLDAGKPRLGPPPQPFGKGAAVEEGVLYLFRDHRDEPAGFSFEAEDAPLLWRLEVEHHIENPLGVGLEGDALPLALTAGGDQRVLSDTAHPTDRLLPLGVLWFLVPAGTPLRIETRAEAAVFRIKLESYEPRPGEALAAIRLADPRGSRTLPVSAHRP